MRLAKVVPWLDEVLRKDPVEAARLIGDALAATNRVAMSDCKRLDLAEKYWETANSLWPRARAPVLPRLAPADAEMRSSRPRPR